MIWMMLGNALLIFCLRLVDVSLGTVRLIMIGRGQRKIAPLLGFVEVTIWVVAISQVITNLDNIFNIFGYSSGFAAGTLVGMWIEDKLALGHVEISIISTTRGQKIVRKLRQADYGVTELVGNGRSGIVNLITTIVPRKDVKDVFQLVNQTDPKSFIAIDDMKTVTRGYMHVAK
ncbi:MAG: DUF2179 domain-containing protein [Anaerolineae bacterium]|jgi:uncharacterized protein YebE (UPF0316 family)